MRNLSLYEMLIGIINLLLSVYLLFEIANGNSTITNYIAAVATSAVIAILIWRIFSRRKSS